MTKNYYFLLCLIVCTVFSSCDDDEKEAVPPVVTITAPDASVKLKRTVTITASATDDSGISSVKIFVDETLLDDAVADEVSFDWDTETVSNGVHIIKVTATDDVGNEASESLSVEVFNDKTAPLVTVTSPSTQPFIKSTVKIEGSVVDDSALESIKIFIDNVLLTTLTNTAAIGYDWDTKTVADGNHTLKVTALDNQGNETSVTKDVKVYNYFITLNVVNPEVPSHVAIYYLISRYDGTLIQMKPYVAGETKIRFETPDNFNADDRYVFSTFTHTGKYQAFNTQTQFFVEGGYKPGETNISPRYTYGNSTDSQFIGYHTMTIDNVPSHQYLFMTGVNMWSSTNQNNALSIQIGFYNYNNNNLNPYVAVLRGVDEAPRFKKFTGLQVDGTTQVNFDDFTVMTGNKIAAAPDAAYTYDNVFGVSGQNYNEGNSVWSYNNFSQPNKDHYLYHPPTGFSEYIFSLQESVANENHFFLHVGSQAPSTMLKSNAMLSSYLKQQRTISLQTSGTYDMLSLSGSRSEVVNNEAIFYYWYVQLPDGTNHSITLPQLPATLANYNFPDLATIAFSNASFSDYSGISGFSELKNFPVANPGVSIYTVSKDYVSKSFAIPNPGGRIKYDDFDQTHRIMLENNKRMGLNPYYTMKK
jgi:hypothetical protein